MTHEHEILLLKSATSFCVILSRNYRFFFFQRFHEPDLQQNYTFFDETWKIRRKIGNKTKGGTKQGWKTSESNAYKWKNNNNEVYLFCYEYGFLSLDSFGKNKYLIIDWQDYMEK